MQNPAQVESLTTFLGKYRSKEEREQIKLNCQQQLEEIKKENNRGFIQNFMNDLHTDFKNYVGMTMIKKFETHSFE